jgi:hypothetical protein
VKPVFQTTIDPQEGDCFRACIASLLEVDLEKVPFIPPSTGAQLRLYRDWLAPLGWTIIVVEVYGPRKHRVAQGLPVGTLMLVSGKSKTFENGLHVVVGRIKDKSGEYELAHDPNPSGSGIGEPYYYYFFAPLSPHNLEVKP